GIAYMAKTVAAVELEGRLGFPDAERSDLALAIDADVQSLRYPQAGIWWQVLPWLELGASFRGGYRLLLDTQLTVKADVGAVGSLVVEDGLLALHSLAQDLFQPQQWSAGFSAHFTRRLIVAFDVA